MAKKYRRSTDNENGGNNIAVKDPTINVQHLLESAVSRLDDLRTADYSRLHHDVESEIHRIDEKIKDNKEFSNLRVDDTIIMSNQRFEAQQLALKDALISQEKAVAAALVGAKEVTDKNDANTNKRFDLLSEKMDGIGEQISKNVGASGIYVTHSDLSTEMEKLRTSFEGMLRPVITFMNTQTGQQRATDPMMVTMAAEIKALALVVENNKGKGQGAAALWGWIVGGVMFLIAMVQFIIPYLRTP